MTVPSSKVTRFRVLFIPAATKFSKTISFQGLGGKTATPSLPLCGIARLDARVALTCAAKHTLRDHDGLPFSRNQDFDITVIPIYMVNKCHAIKLHFSAGGTICG
jgi:hypothetical protein